MRYYDCTRRGLMNQISLILAALGSALQNLYFLLHLLCFYNSLISAMPRLGQKSVGHLRILH